jgi:hypothetical protein
MPYLPFSPSNHLLYSAPAIPPCCFIPGGTWPGSLFSSTICLSCIFTRSVSTIALCRRRWLFGCGLFYARTNRCLDGLFGAPLCSHTLDSSNLVVLMSILEKQYCIIKESLPFPCVCSMQLSSLIGRFGFRSRRAGTYSHGAVLRKFLAVRYIFIRLSKKRVVPSISLCWTPLCLPTNPFSGDCRRKLRFLSQSAGCLQHPHYKVWILVISYRI